MEKSLFNEFSLSRLETVTEIWNLTPEDSGVVSEPSLILYGATKACCAVFKKGKEGKGKMSLLAIFMKMNRKTEHPLSVYVEQYYEQ